MSKGAFDGLVLCFLVQREARWNMVCLCDAMPVLGKQGGQRTIQQPCCFFTAFSPTILKTSSIIWSGIFWCPSLASRKRPVSTSLMCVLSPCPSSNYQQVFTYPCLGKTWALSPQPAAICPGPHYPLGLSTRQNILCCVLFHWLHIALWIGVLVLLFILF